MTPYQNAASAENQSGYDIYSNHNAHPHSSTFWPARVENPPLACLPDTNNTCQHLPTSLPLWLATLSRIATCCTGATAAGARHLDLHRSFSHQTSHTTQPPRFRAAATTACVTAKAAMPNSEEGSVVCCVPSCTDCHVKS